MAVPRFKTAYDQDAAFECCVCCDDKEAGDPYVKAGADPMCKNCFLANLKPRFLAALKSENDFPVSWGDETLDLDDFPDFSMHQRIGWRLKVKEYNTPRTLRVYHKHRYYIDTNRRKHVPEFSTADTIMAQAEEKGWQIGEAEEYVGTLTKTTVAPLKCALCGTQYYDLCGTEIAQVGQEHDCNAPMDPSGERPELSTQGKDYQICPNPTCHFPGFRTDGCNTMICKCRTHYCFICGVKAHHDSDHWTRGGCPRWNQPSANNAGYDRAPPPLVIPERIARLARELRQQAEDATSEKVQRLRAMQALCYDLHGDAIARLRRGRGPFGQNAAIGVPLEKLLINCLQGALHPDHYRIDGRPAKNLGKKLKRCLGLFRGRLSDLETKTRHFVRTHPEVFDLYPQLGALLMMATDIIEEEIEELEEIVEGRRAAANEPKVEQVAERVGALEL